MVDTVDFSTDEDANPAVAPFTTVGQQVGNEQSQTCRQAQIKALDLIIFLHK